MSNLAATQSIQVEADPKRVLSLLAKTFTRGTTVLGELLQNARRAGATRVEITLAEDLIEFKDDGVGIADFSVLLAIAKSGWDEAVVRAESAYGAGFLATLFCCDRIEVQSRGAMMSAQTADLIAIKPTPIVACPDDGVTVIRLHRPRIKAARGDSVDYAIKQLCMGFPIAVTINGQQVDRPHAADAQPLVALDIGHVSPRLLEGCSPAAIYLQGLPIGPRIASGFSRFTEPHSVDVRPSVIHLDPQQFLGRMPDRDTLIDPEASATRIAGAIRAAARERLLAIAATMTPEAFVAAHADEAAWVDLRDLLNGIDVVPARWLYKYDEMPTMFDISVSEDRSTAESGGLVSRAYIERVGLYLPETEDDGGNYDLTAVRYVHAKEAYCADAAPEWHWLASLRCPVRPEDIRIVPGTLLGEDQFDVYDTHTVRVCESVGLMRIDENGEPVGPAIAVDSVMSSEGDTLYVVPDGSTHEAVGLISGFTMDEDTFLETDRDRASQNLRVARDGVLHSDPAALFRALITEHGLPATLPKTLCAKAFTVTISAEGVVSVT